MKTKTPPQGGSGVPLPIQSSPVNHALLELVPVRLGQDELRALLSFKAEGEEKDKSYSHAFKSLDDLGLVVRVKEDKEMREARVRIAFEELVETAGAEDWEATEAAFEELKLAVDSADGFTYRLTDFGVQVWKAAREKLRQQFEKK